MNYRHAFHAGNFADLVKHAALIALMDALRTGKAPLHVLDTHAGAGLYDLGDPMARRSGEAAAGIVRLMADADAPAAYAPLKAAVRALNPEGGVRLYPGSPVIAAARLRPGDAYLGCELRPDDHALLVRALAAHPGRGRAEALKADGYDRAARASPSGARRLILIDPPFEAADEYDRVIRATGAILARDRAAVIAVWTPLKDLDTFDRFISALEALGPPQVLIAETRLRPLHDPLKMNGCAMVVVGAPAQAQSPIAEAAQWAVGRLGDPGGAARIWRVGG